MMNESLKSNVHTHTTFSDGKNTAEEMVQAALKLGFFSLGFSDHGPSKYDSAAMPGEDDYKAEIRRLQKKYAGQIEIALGIERDFTAPELNISDYDYVIESVHYVRPHGAFVPVDDSPEVTMAAVKEHYSGDIYAYCADYMDQLCRSIEQTGGEIIGHIGLPEKFNENNAQFDPDDPRYWKPAVDALKLCVEKDRIVEINTGAMSRGWRTAPYPNRRLLKKLHDMGGRIMLGSDCHHADWLTTGFDMAAQLARDCGFSACWVWKNGHFEEAVL